jgi:CubicO group peptidase (beta-lactamase class C family)
MTRLAHRVLGLTALLAASLVTTPALAKPKAAPALAGFDAYVSRAMREFGVPGMAVAVVRDGAVVLAKGYGVRRAGEPATVDADTLFGIASNTKAFTCVALSILVEEGRLAWDDPVTRHLPEFQMYDPWVTREVTVRDLVTHRAGLGLGGGDLMWWPPTDFTRREIVRGIRHVKPASSLRSRYAYNNVTFVAAGEVVAAVAGTTWDAFVKERILAPIGMSRTTTTVPAATVNLAAPHLELKGVVAPAAPMDFANAGAAAGIHSSASDMARWLTMLLECAEGKEAPLPPPAGPAGPGGAGRECVLKPESIRRMWSAQTVQGTPDPPTGLEPIRANFAAYGLGFGLRDYRGRKIVGHTGGLPGYVSQVALVPEERLGLVVLTNQEETGAFEAIKYRILDEYLGAPVPPVDWIAAFRKRAEDERKKAEGAVAKAASARDATSRPSLPLARYAGRYRDAWYGDATIAEESGRLVLTMTRTPRMVADLAHWQHDTFVARWRRAWMSDEAPADAYVSFALKPDASIDRMTMAPVSPAIDFSFDFQDLLFTRVPATVKDAKAP